MIPCSPKLRIYPASTVEWKENTPFTSSRSADGMGSPVTVKTLCTPSADNPSSSAFVALILRSRQVICGIGSIPNSRCSFAASIELSTQARATGQSATVMASTPTACNVRAPAINLSKCASLGGSSSTAITRFPARSLFANRFCTLRGTGVLRTTASTGCTSVSCRISAVRRICSGVVPQHPPIIFTPVDRISAIRAAK